MRVDGPEERGEPLRVLDLPQRGPAQVSLLLGQARRSGGGELLVTGVDGGDLTVWVAQRKR